MLNKIENEELLDLIFKAQQGDKFAQERIIKGYERSVYSIIRKKHYDFTLGAKGVEKEDLFQIGCMGLYRAIMTYDANRDIKFITWAITNIESYIARYSRDINTTMKLTRGTKELYRNIKKCKDDFYSKNCREATRKEISEILKVEESKIDNTLLAYSYECFDKNQAEEGEKEMSLKHSVADKKVISENVILDKMYLNKAINTLKEYDRKVIYRIFFLGESQTKASKSVGKSQITVSRSQKKSLNLMREYFNAIGFKYENN